MENEETYGLCFLNHYQVGKEGTQHYSSSVHLLWDDLFAQNRQQGQLFAGLPICGQSNKRSTITAKELHSRLETSSIRYSESSPYNVCVWFLNRHNIVTIATYGFT